MHESPLPKVPETYLEIDNNIMMNYRPDVTNACDGRLFPENPQYNSKLRFTSLTWPQLVERNPDLVRQIMERVSTVWNSSETIGRRGRARSYLTKLAKKAYKKLRSY